VRKERERSVPRGWRIKKFCVELEEGGRGDKEMRDPQRNKRGSAIEELWNWVGGRGEKQHMYK